MLLARKCRVGVMLDTFGSMMHWRISHDVNVVENIESDMPGQLLISDPIVA